MIVEAVLGIVGLLLVGIVVAERWAVRTRRASDLLHGERRVGPEGRERL